MVSSKVNDLIVLFDLWMKPKRVLPLQVKMDQVVMAIEYFTFLKAPGMETHPQIV